MFEAAEVDPLEQVPHQAPQVSNRQFDSTFFHQVPQSD